MKHIWSVLCETAILSKYSNNVSLIEIVEEITFSVEGEVQGLPLKLSLVSCWHRTSLDQPEDAKERIVLLSPNGEELITGEIAVDLKEHQRSRNFFNLVGIPFAGSGTYDFVVQFQDSTVTEWQVAAVIPLEITRKDATN